jgi:hypothetical protein
MKKREPAWYGLQPVILLLQITVLTKSNIERYMDRIVHS